ARFCRVARHRPATTQHRRPDGPRPHLQAGQQGELVRGFPRLAAIVEPLLSVRRVMRQQLSVPHKMLLDMVRANPVRRRLILDEPGWTSPILMSWLRCEQPPLMSSIHVAVSSASPPPLARSLAANLPAGNAFHALSLLAGSATALGLKAA